MAASLPQHEEITLENNLKVVAIPTHNDSGVISVDLFYSVGSRNEIMGKSGLAHMLEHLHFKSTKNLKAGEFDQIVKKIGGVTNASTGFDYTHYFIKTATHNLDKSLELFAELMSNLTLAEEEFLPERDVVAEERRWRTDNTPTGAMFFTLFNTAFLHHPYHWTPIGFMEDIQGWTIDDIRAFHRKWYQPQNAILIVSGDIENKAVFSAAQKRFGAIKNREQIKPITASEPDQMGARRAIVEKQSEVEMLMIGWKIPPFDHEDIEPLNALSEILSAGASSRLQEKLVDKLQLVNQISAFTMEQTDPGLFVIMAVCNPGVKAEAVEQQILDEIALLQKKGVKLREVDKVKTQSKSGFVYSLERADSIASMYGEYLIRGNLSVLLDHEAKIEALEAGTIQFMANKYLVPKRSTTIILRKAD